MPISGVVITTRPDEKAEVLHALAAVPGVEVHGDDGQGNIVAVLETKSSEDMERLIDRINKDPLILHVGMTYLNTEDEAAAMTDGRPVARPFGYRKPLAGGQ